MTPASEVAKGLAYDIALGWCKEQHQQCEKADEIIPLIAQALTAYANEASAGMQTTMKKMADEWVAKARASALEEAAKVADQYGNVGDAIRALKDKP